MKEQWMIEASVALAWVFGGILSMKLRLWIMFMVATLAIARMSWQGKNAMIIARYPGWMEWKADVFKNIAMHCAWCGILIALGCLWHSLQAGTGISFLLATTIDVLYLFWMSLAGSMHPAGFAACAITLVPSLGMDLSMQAFACIYDSQSWTNLHALTGAIAMHGSLCLITCGLFKKWRLG